MNRLTLFFAAAFISFSQAAQAGDSGVYLGAGLADGDMTACPTLYSNCNNHTRVNDIANLRLVGGYNFNRYVGIEGGLANLGTYDVQNIYGINIGTVKASAITLAAKGGYKFSFGMSLFGKLGLATVKTQYTPGPGWIYGGLDSNQRSTGVVFGFGVQYDFNDSVGIRIAMEALSFKDDLFTGAVAGTNLLAIYKL